MGTDYTLACRACKTSAYIDRHGAPLTCRQTDVVEWAELDYPEPVRHSKPLPVISTQSLDESEADYFEARDGIGILPEIRAFVAEHEPHGPGAKSRWTARDATRRSPPCQNSGMHCPRTTTRRTS